MKKKGFTLVELLVVISIIAMLLAILMPALSKAREIAKTVICEANFKGMNTAVFAATTDRQDKLLAAYEYRDDNAPITKTGDEWVWAPTNVETGLTVAADPTLEERKEGIRRGALYPYAENVDLFHCLNDKTDKDHFRTYSIPDCLNGIMQYYPAASKIWDCVTKASQIRRPAEKIVFVEENDPRYYNMGSWQPDFFSAKYTFIGDPMAVWHGGKSSMAFADGHCEQKKWSDDVYEYFKNFENFANFRCPSTEAEKDWEWIKKGWTIP